MTYLSFVSHLLRPHRKRLVIGLIAMFGIMLVDLGSPLVLAVLIDKVVGENRYDLLPPLMIVFLLLPFGAAIFHFVSGQSITIVGQRIILDIRLKLYHRIQKLHCRFLHNTTTGKIMERLRGDVHQLQMLLTGQVPQLLIQVVTGIIMIAVMLVMSFKLTLVVIFGLCLYMVNYKWLVPRIRKVQRRFRRKMDSLSGMAQERLGGEILVKSFDRERQEAREFVRHNFTTERVFHRFSQFGIRYSILSSLITWSTYVPVMILGTLLVIRGEITYGVVVAFLAFAHRLLLPAAMLAEMSNQLQQGRVSLDRIFELMQAEPDVIEQPGTKLDNLKGEISFQNVHFHYDAEKPVLKGLNLDIKPGATVALVGETGCGKSTIINLLYRYYDITGGTLTIDGQDIRTFDTRWYRRHLAMVPQEPIILDTTIAENIAYGNPNASIPQIVKAARDAELEEVISRLDDGLDTVLGEYGAKLSVGEKQRLCIARAILSDPVILILDEATSSLDSHSEAMIQMAMRRVMAGRTSIIVAHRLSTIINADLIVVLEAGRILDMGNHAQLMSRPNGKYRHLYLTQTGAMPKAGTG